MFFLSSARRIRILTALYFSFAVAALGGDERVMVFAPHPDDEMLTCAGVMKRALVEGDALKVVIMTNGDAHVRAREAWEKRYPEQVYDRDDDGDFDMVDFGIVRHDESLGVLESLGVPAEDVIYLSYPDTGVDDMWRGSTYESPFTLHSKVPEAYGFAFNPGASYTRASCLADVKQVIRDFKPTFVYTPRPSDTHQDHWALERFVAQALMESYDSVPWKAHFGYLTHWEANVPDWPKTGLDWGTPDGHAPPALRLQLAPSGLTPDRKRQLIAAYKSQVVLSEQYLLNFAKASEIFWLESLGPKGHITEVLKPR